MTVTLVSSALRRAPSKLYTGIRLLSSSAAREASWGFIGLGAMGLLSLDCLGLHVLIETRLSDGEEPPSQNA